MIWCVTLNPSLDIVYRVPGRFQPGGIYRTEPLERAGGKGNNVARAVARLGHGVTSVGIYGGLTGANIRGRLQKLGVPSLYQESGEESRRCLTIVGNEDVTEIREPGPPIPLSVGATLLRNLLQSVSRADWVTLSGSLPADWPDDTYFEWIQALKPRVAGIVLDTSGLPLRRGVEAQPTAIVPNQAEYQELDDRAIKGVHTIITAGPRGAIWITPSRERLRLSTRPVTVRNPVGAGDSFLGGLVFALSQGRPMMEAIRYAVAVGTSSVTTEAVGDIDPDLIQQLVELVHVVRSEDDELT